MTNKVIKMIMICIMLTAQIGESFALSFMPCADDGKMVINDNNLGHSKHSLPMDKSSVTPDEDCCQKNCSCPMGLLSVAVPSEPSIDWPIDYKTSQLNVGHSTIHNLFFALPQRPPKSTF